MARTDTNGGWGAHPKKEGVMRRALRWLVAALTYALIVATAGAASASLPPVPPFNP